MKSIIYSATHVNGVIDIPLLTECKCKIGLVSISIPNMNRIRQSDDFQDIEISCDQVDSTYLNPKRLLRKICTQKNEHLYNTFEFNNILFFDLDSADHKLTFRIRDQHGPISIPDYIHKKVNPRKITICLQLQPIDDQIHKWIKYI